jgi:hypothetical protein
MMKILFSYGLYKLPERRMTLREMRRKMLPGDSDVGGLKLRNFLKSFLVSFFP